MKLKTDIAKVKPDIGSLSINERATLACNLAKQFEKAGKYDSARDALREFWPDRAAEPKLQGLAVSIQAELLLRMGAVAGWLGAADQLGGSQDEAKDLITRSIGLFQEPGDDQRLAEAHKDLAICYFREGSFDEARIHLGEALGFVSEADTELRAIILIWSGLVEAEAGRLQEALHLYDQAAPLVERTDDHAVKGAFHSQFGLALRRLATPENREEYIDRALVEYAAASYHFEQAGNDRYVARVENNLGYLYFTIGRYQDAHAHLDRARHIFLRLKDLSTAAQVDETRARTLLAQRHPVEAERIVRAAVRVLERGDQRAVLAEALATHAAALARLGNDVRARALFDRAIDTATTAGDLEGAGRVKLSIIEELGEKIPARDLISIYRSAITLLKTSQDPTSIKRLMSCGEMLFEALERLEHEQREFTEEWDGFSFKRYVKSSESKVIERALREAEGSVTKAAKLLGFRHHQSLISLLNTRHRDLIHQRSIARKRRRHIVGKQSRRTARKQVVLQPEPEVPVGSAEDRSGDA